MTTPFPKVTAAEWRAQVEKDLAGASFDKTLVLKTPEGLSVQPLYTEAPPLVVPGMPDHFLIATNALAPNGGGGPGEGKTNEALWIEADSIPKEGAAFLILNGTLLAALAPDTHFALTTDPLAPQFLADAKKIDADFPNGRAGTISTLQHHDDGADAADELAIALSTGVAALESLLQAGFTPARAARQLAVQIAVGRDTFAELCKLRALRLCWDKLTTAAGAPGTKLLVHAVCSSRTLTQRDPWVNMLRGTTQVFAAVLGGADLVTPTSFDQELGPASPLGARVAHNTGLVLRHESALGRVIDPAAGSYYLDQFTDALAREAWKRFQLIEASGGIVQALPKLRQRITAAWEQ